MRLAAMCAVPLAILASQPAASQAPAVVSVQLASFKFMPRDIVLRHGQAYVLKLANVSSANHDFTASDFFAASNIAAADRAMVQDGSVEVPSGQVRQIHLTAPGAAGNYHLKCSHTFHKTFGMSGTIVVQ